MFFEEMYQTESRLWNYKHSVFLVSNRYMLVPNRDSSVFVFLKEYKYIHLALFMLVPAVCWFLLVNSSGWVFSELFNTEQVPECSVLTEWKCSLSLTCQFLTSSLHFTEYLCVHTIHAMLHSILKTAITDRVLRAHISCPCTLICLLVQKHTLGLTGINASLFPHWVIILGKKMPIKAWQGKLQLFGLRCYTHYTEASL